MRVLSYFKKPASLFLVFVIAAASLLSVFSADDQNARVVSALTPTGPAEAKYIRSFGKDYATAPTSPILAEDCLVIFSGFKLYKLDKSTGEEIASVKAESRITFTTVSPLYHDGVIYMQLDGGIVQAFDFDTLEPLWIYRDPIGGQALCPIRYDDGNIYTAFWDGETREANYVCLSVKDPDPDEPMTEKEAVWTFASPGGFYRTGCAFYKNFIVFGTDDGARGSDGKSRIVVLDKKTGKFVSSAETSGDIRTDVVYDGETNAFYTASKTGIVYRFAIDGASGKIFDIKSYNANGSVTSAPVIYRGRLYIGAQNGMEGRFIVLDAVKLDEIYSDALPGYPQAGMLVSTGYEITTDKVYVYTTYNNKPGGIYVFEDSAGQTEPVKREVFAPPEEASQFCISQIVADPDGTLYYKNDSGNIFAISSRTEAALPDHIIALIRSVIDYVIRIFTILRTIFA